MTYFDWLRNKGCGCNNGCKDINPCSCDEILLEISNLHTDDQVLQTEIDDLSGKVETISGVVDTKLDASAYTPTDLSDYYTKEEVNDIADDKLDASAYTPTDLSNYYNKQEVNDIVESAITDVESEIPSLSGYATEQWVLDKHYITGVDLSDYATEQWVEDKNYLTEHQPLKTINGQVISGTGNIVIEASGTSVTVDDHLDSASTNPVQNKVIVGALNDKLDVSAYTPTDLSNYYTKDEVNSAITEVESEIPSLSGYATEQWVESQGYLTDVDLSDYALTADTYTKTEVNNLVSNKIWCGTQAEYDALPTKQNDVLYLIHQ